MTPEIEQKTPWTPENTAERIKAIRKALGRTQEGMARIMNTSQVTLCRWERGRHIPAPVYRALLETLERKYVKKDPAPPAQADLSPEDLNPDEEGDPS